jgi:VWFA-related protein
MQLSTPNRVALFLFALLPAVVLFSIPLYAADESGYTIRSSASEVRLAFTASDREGHVIKTLHSCDVAVADNGSIIRQFRSFRPASQGSLDLVILLDASDSVALQIPSEIAEARDFVAHTAWGERDRVSIVAFGGLRPQLLCARNCHGEAAQARLNTLGANGATPLFDALLQAAEILMDNRDPESRPAMLLFSDGVDTISMHTAADALRAAQNLQAVIYSVNCRGKKAAVDHGDAMLDYLAGSTGGLSFGPGNNVAAVLRMVVEDLHAGYVLTYLLPEQSIGQHSIRILPTNDPKLQFRSRQAYDDDGGE